MSFIPSFSTDCMERTNAENENARNHKETTKTSQTTTSSAIRMISTRVFFWEAWVLNCYCHPKALEPYFRLCRARPTKIIFFAKKTTNGKSTWFHTLSANIVIERKTNYEIMSSEMFHKDLKFCSSWNPIKFTKC